MPWSKRGTGIRRKVVGSSRIPGSWHNFLRLDDTKTELFEFRATHILSPPVNILLTVQSRCFFCGSFMFFLSCVCYAFLRVCLYVPCGHLLGKG